MAAADALYEIMSVMVKRGPLSLADDPEVDLWEPGRPCNLGKEKDQKKEIESSMTEM